MIGSTKITYKVEKFKNVRIQIFDQAGRFVKTLIDCEHAPGIHSIEWDGKSENGQNTISGTYFISANGYESAKFTKMR